MDRALDRIKTTLAHMLCEEYSSILETSDCASAIKFDRSPSFDIAEMTKLLDHDNHTLRTALRDLLKDEVFVHQWDISLEQQRELTISRLRKILSFTFNGEPLLSVKHFRTNPLRIFAVHEIVAQADISAAILLAVQFNSFGGTVLKMGTHKHHGEFLDKIDRMEAFGSFAMTELGHGNNVAELETTATFDEKNNQFILHTPSPLAQKFWVTSTVSHKAQWAVVFARLMLPETSIRDGPIVLDKGIHAFLCRIRNDDGQLVEGISVVDLGKKFGCNGVDHGRMSFNQVVLPKDALLNQIADIDETGEYLSLFKSPREQFHAVSEQLISSRLCLASMFTGLCKVALTIAMKFCASRQAQGPEGKQNWPILSFQLQQRALMPLLATTVAYNVALDYVKTHFERTMANRAKRPVPKLTSASQAAGYGSVPSAKKDDDGLDEEQIKQEEELVVLSCVMKPLVTWHCFELSSVCRERLGAQAYLSCNRLGDIMAASQGGITAEGDNALLMQKVTKELLALLAQGQLYLINPDRALYPNFNSAPFLLYLLRLRFSKKIRHLSAQIKKEVRGKGGKTLFDLLELEQSEQVQSCARAYGEMVVMERFSHIQENSQVHVQEMLDELMQLYGLNAIEKDLSWFIADGVLSGEDSRHVKSKINELSTSLASQALWLVQSFAVPDHLIQAPIAFDWEEYNQHDYHGEVKGATLY